MRSINIYFIMVYQVNLNAVISNGYYIFTVTILRDLFSYNIKMLQHYVKEYDTLQLIVGFIQTKPTTQMTSFIYDTISSISTTHIWTQLLFIFLCQNVPIMLEWYSFRLSDTHNLDTKHIVGMIPFPSFWYFLIHKI